MHISLVKFVLDLVVLPFTWLPSISPIFCPEIWTLLFGTHDAKSRTNAGILSKKVLSKVATYISYFYHIVRINLVFLFIFYY